MTAVEQLTIDRLATSGQTRAGEPVSLPGEPAARSAKQAARLGELAARRTLRAQVSRLERELSSVVASGFPHIRPPRTPSPGDVGGPRLLSLGELERLRDSLVARVDQACRQAAARSELAHRSRVLLEEMKREPRRHKFVRLPLADLGQGGCGVWEVRPRLGLIGMLAGWWQVKLSSGCP